MIQRPVHYDFPALRQTPAEVRADFAARGWHRVVASELCDPMYRAHQELTLRAARELDAKLFIQPVVGVAEPTGVDHYTRVRAYQVVLASHPAGIAKLGLLPLETRMAGPREVVWLAIIRKNFGCTDPITRGLAATPVESHSIARTKRKTCCASTRSSLASPWRLSARWCT